MQVTITGTDRLCVDDDEWTPVTDAKVLQKLDGFQSGRDEDDAFAAYIGDGPADEPIAGIGISEGYIDLKYDRQRNTLLIVTEYQSPRQMTDEELSVLVNHTTGQWSDGLGESLNCAFVDDNGLYLDLAPSDQEVSVQQT